MEGEDRRVVMPSTGDREFRRSSSVADLGSSSVELVGIVLSFVAKLVKF